MEFIFTAEHITIITIATICSIIALLAWVIVLDLRLRRITKNSNGESLEKHMADIAESYKDVQSVQNRLTSAVRGVGLTRFNPFAGSGGSKPSFALALLNELGDGVIISTLHARDQVTLFSKEVNNFKPETETTEEEQSALEKARKSLHNAERYAEQR